MTLASKLRAAGLSVAMDYELKSMKAQMRAANKSAAKLALIVGESELEAKELQIKNLQTSDQSTVAFDDVIDFVENSI
jgi:histidyl-tRNA synthetase